MIHSLPSLCSLMETAMPDVNWMQCSASGAVGLITGLVLNFVFKTRGQTNTAFLQIIAAQSDSMNLMRQRIGVLEEKIENLHRENLKCHQDYSTVLAELKMLRERP